MDIGVLDGGLRLPNSPEAGDGLRQRGGLAGGEGSVKPDELVLAAGEEGIALVGDIPGPLRWRASRVRRGC